MVYDKVHRVLKTVFPVPNVCMDQGKSTVCQSDFQQVRHCLEFHAGCKQDVVLEFFGGRVQDDDTGGRQLLAILLGLVAVEKTQIVVPVLQPIPVALHGVEHTMFVSGCRMMSEVRQKATEFGIAPTVDIEVILTLCRRGHLVLWNTH
ncbi:hypothetical protein PJM37_0010 [Salmonella phage vB_SenM_UTK0004]|nr:hypothetical protein PJM37_0010 [Salmonella phage vB_SenM_UTK0004]